MLFRSTLVKLVLGFLNAFHSPRAEHVEADRREKMSSPCCCSSLWTKYRRSPTCAVLLVLMEFSQMKPIPEKSAQRGTIYDQFPLLSQGRIFGKLSAY